MGESKEAFYFNKTADETLFLLETNTKAGLTTAKAQTLLNKYGLNELTK